MAAMLLLAMGVIIATIEIGKLLNESAAARTAADAAALAGAAAGREAAESMAAANGGVLLAYEEDEPTDDSDGLLISVAVRVGRASQTARAERQVEWVAPSGRA
jgi:Flp pilus assembly protein TadG